MIPKRTTSRYGIREGDNANHQEFAVQKEFQEFRRNYRSRDQPEVKPQTLPESIHWIRLARMEGGL